MSLRQRLQKLVARAFPPGRCRECGQKKDTLTTTVIVCPDPECSCRTNEDYANPELWRLEGGYPPACKTCGNYQADFIADCIKNVNPLVRPKPVEDDSPCRTVAEKPPTMPS